MTMARFVFLIGCGLFAVHFREQSAPLFVLYGYLAALAIMRAEQKATP